MDKFFNKRVLELVFDESCEEEIYIDTVVNPLGIEEFVESDWSSRKTIAMSKVSLDMILSDERKAALDDRMTSIHERPTLRSLEAAKP